MIHTVIFVENSSNIPNILSKIVDIRQTKVISCDIFSHETLSQMGIDHQMIENYMHENDQNLIDKLIIDKSHEWYRQEGITELLEFENMNLGSLLELEIGPYFLQTMKNFIGVKRVIDQENPSIVISSTSLSVMVKIFTVGKNIIIESYSLPNTTSLTYNRVQISYNIGKKLFSIWVSRKLAFKIKNTLEFMINLIFKFKFNFSNISTRKSIIIETNSSIDSTSFISVCFNPC